MRFLDKTAIITGASNGIGKALALRLTREGAQTVLNARRMEGLLAVQAEAGAAGKSPLIIAGDVTLMPTIDNLVNKSLADFGRIDIWINNVGGASPACDLENISEEDWDHSLDFNLKSAFLCCRAVAPVMKRQGYGRIVNVSSFAGRFRSRLGGPQYASAKAGMLGLTRQLAWDLGPFGITVNAVAPGISLTPRVQSKWDDRTQETQAQILDSIPLQRLAEPEEIAAAIAFLASDDASYITGVTLDVNGGSFMS
jgi:NAD(P)-dependent dehydrogenase (short-subunit alcohol dehydrogenase family)